MKIENNSQVNLDRSQLDQGGSGIITKDEISSPTPPISAESVERIFGEINNYALQMRDKLTQAFNDFRETALQTAIESAAWQGIPETISLKNLVPESPQNDPESLAALQKFLVGAGYLAPPESTSPPYVYGEFFGKMTTNALAAFQAGNGIDPPTRSVDAATIAQLRDPRPRPGYTQNTLDGSASPQYLGAFLEEAGNYFSNSLGEPISGAVVQPDESILQYYEKGIVRQTADGGFYITDYEGNSLINPPDYNSIKDAAGNYLISQLDGDPDGRNNNCGYASLLMALNYLGVPNSQISNETTDNYELTMALRLAGNDGTDDQGSSHAANVFNSATTLEGVNAEVFGVPNITNEQAVERMKLIFLSGESQTAFVVAGNPATGWGDDPAFAGQYDTRSENPYNGSHFVTVIGYNSGTDKFLVLDPIAKVPVEVSGQQMLDYMSDTGVQYNDVLQLTYNSSSAN